MKILCVGDIHAKPQIVYAVAKLVKDYDRVIFLGDYADDWGADPDQSRIALEAVTELATLNPVNVVLLRGNHDFSEYYGYTKREFICSGFNIGTHNLCQRIYRDNWHRLYTAYIIHGNSEEVGNDWWISHAGITNGWYKQWDEYWDSLTFDGKSNTSLLDTEVFLNQVGSARGGRSLNPSPIWVDYYELIANPKTYVNQIVGHTPVKTVTCHEFKNGDGIKNKIFFCDTFSTYTDGTPYGDGSCLSLDTEAGTWEKVYPMKGDKDG
jgi:hypothetical protein